MAVVTYASLSSGEKEAIQEAKILVQKTLPTKSGTDEDDVYAIFVKYTVLAADNYPPVTSYGLGGEPLAWYPVIVLGCRCQAYKYLETYWAEVPNMSSAGVPFADRTAYMERWAKLYGQLEPQFRKDVAMLKTQHFPSSSMIVSTYQPDVLLRGMWEWPRYYRY